MDVRILKYFLAVAQEQNITHAAETLHTSQSNLSRQLATFEEELGKRLFNRETRKLTLTDEGLFLRKRAQEIVDLVNRTANDLTSFDADISGDVYLAAAETPAMRRLADVMRIVQTAHPKIKFHVFSGSTIEVSEQLDAGLVDFGILVEPVDLQKYDYLRLPVKDTWGVLMRPDSPLAQKATIAPNDLHDKPILGSRQMLDGNVLSGWLGTDPHDLNIVATFNLINSPAMMIERGMGYAFTFKDLVNTTGNPDLCFRPLAPKMETSLYLVWKKYQVMTPANKLFLKKLREELVF
ncbi:LysR family transcriptional regulator [Lactiplantibacillus fabifermentans T30PCM01]|uniref:LysR family transcriptional regulator n=1 Tax=Lactiplantibacillus fabifermentans T30PCM01 TaxID=1400520 RepID=W6T3U4_9LACO|nr:LysR family transcriptional regulator [Lactiplantibacillus fabifermentans]ETY72532.1 LysR family transcriptional regulator [Lactiplantibacillus fabifermentans T30PCM01]